MPAQRAPGRLPNNCRLVPSAQVGVRMRVLHVTSSYSPRCARPDRPLHGRDARSSCTQRKQRRSPNPADTWVADRSAQRGTGLRLPSRVSESAQMGTWSQPPGRRQYSPFGPRYDTPSDQRSGTQPSSSHRRIPSGRRPSSLARSAWSTCTARSSRHSCRDLDPRADAPHATGRATQIARAALRRSNAIVAASSGVIDTISSLDPITVAERSTIIPHGAKDELFGSGDKQSARRSLGIDDERQLVLAVGRLVPKKGFHHLIDASEHLPEVQVVIVGDGPERAVLERRSRATDGRVRLVGEAGRSAVSQWLTAADVVVVPSLHSAFATRTADLSSSWRLLLQAGDRWSPDASG